MKETIEVQGMTFLWNAYQNSDTPELDISYGNQKFYLQVLPNKSDILHNEMFLKGQKTYPITNESVLVAIDQLISKGYLEIGQGDDVSLTLMENGELFEN